MKPLHLYLPSLFISVSAFSQPVLSSAVHMPSAGDLITSHTAILPNPDPGSAGANQIWNFSAMQIKAGALYDQYLNAASTPYASGFPNANIALFDTSGYFSYFSQQASDMSKEGGTGPYSYAEYYSLPALHFPFTYGDTIAGTDSYLQHMSGYDRNCSRSVFQIADGYGTLVLPSGTYSNVLRVMNIQTHTWSAQFPGPLGDNGVSRDTVYQWYTASNRFPLMSLRFFSVQTFSNYAFVSARISDAVMSIGQEQVSDRFYCWPNPAHQRVYWKSDQTETGEIRISISDLSGKLMKTLELPDREGDFSISDIPAGLYFMRFDQEEKSSVQKLVIE